MGAAKEKGGGGDGGGEATVGETVCVSVAGGQKRLAVMGNRVQKGNALRGGLFGVYVWVSARGDWATLWMFFLLIDK